MLVLFIKSIVQKEQKLFNISYIIFRFLRFILERFLCIWIGSFCVIALLSEAIGLFVDVSVLMFLTGRGFLFPRGIYLITGLDVYLDVADEGLTSLT